MNDVKLNVKALAAMMEMSIEKLAEECDISVSHLKAVSWGRAKMTANDLKRLSEFTHVNIDNIKID